MYRIGSIGSSQMHGAAQICATQALWILANNGFCGNALSAEEAVQVLRLAQGWMPPPEAVAELIAPDGLPRPGPLMQDVLLVQIVSRTTLRFDGYAVHIPLVRVRFSGRPDLTDILLRAAPGTPVEERRARLELAGWEHGTTPEGRDLLVRAEVVRADDAQLLADVASLHALTGNRLVLVPPVAVAREETFAISADVELSATLGRIAARLGIRLFDPTLAYFSTLARRSDLVADEDVAGFTAAMNSEIARRVIAEVIEPYEQGFPRHSAARAAWFGRWREALVATPVTSSDPDLAEIGATAATHLDDPVSALSHWTLRIAAAEPPPSRFLAAAESALTSGEHALGVEFCRRAVARDPALAGPALNLCEAHCADNSPIITTVCATGIALRPLLGDLRRDGAAWHRIANLALERGEIAADDALAQLALRRLLADVRAAESAGDLDVMRALWPLFEQIGPDSPFHAPARRSYILALLARLRAGGADVETLAEEMLTLDPDNVVAGEIVARRCDREGDREGAATAFDRLAASNPGNARLQIEAIRRWLDIGATTAAEAAYHRAPAQWPTAAFRHFARMLGVLET